MGQSSDRRLLVLALLTAVIAISSAGPVVRVAEPLPAGVIAALRVSITGVLLLVFSLRSTRDVLRKCVAEPELGLRVLAAAAMLALHFGAWITSLTMTSVVRSVALVSTQPIFAGLIDRFFGDRPAPTLYLGTAVAVAGTVVMTVGAPDALAGGAWQGDALALLGALAAAIYLSVGRSVSERLPLRGYFVSVNLVAAALLAGYALALGVDWQPAAATNIDYLSVLYLGVVPGIVGHGLLNWAVRRIPVHVVSLAVLLEPVGAGIIAWVALGERVSPVEAAGALLLLGGVAVGLPRRKV
jgi:drug/metabolite transporter (DMT)-like permease